MKKFLELLNLYFTFFKIGLFTFGGGLSMLPILERELVTKRGWLTSDEIIDYFAIGQSTPGVIAVNVATFCGHKLDKTAGALFATLGVISPSLIIISVIAGVIEYAGEIVLVKKALAGINVAVAANLTYSCLNIAKKTIRNILGVICFLLAFVSVFFFKFPVYIIIFASAFIGFVIYEVKKWTHRL